MKLGKKQIRCAFVWGNMDIGGAETVSFEIAKFIRDQGHHIAFICERGNLSPELEKEGFPCYYGKTNTKNPWVMVEASFLVEKVARKERLNLFYCDNLAQTVMAFLAKKRLVRGSHKGPAVITVMHGHEKAFYYYISSPAYNWLSDRVIGVCDFERQRLIQHGLNPMKVQRIYNGILPHSLPYPFTGKLKQELGIEDEVPLVGYVGRLSPEKDVANAIDSMGKFVFPQTQAHLCIVGDGPERKFLEWKVQDLGIEDRVHFLGFRRDIPNILSSLDLLVLSSLRELFPMVALEALYYECPVVATRIGGVPEVVIDGETGFTAPPGDSEKLGEAILKILDEPDKARKMGQKGRQKVLENFSLEKVGQELLETFLQFIQ